jgi:ParB-like chromosome segregation protein Spo0J
MSEITLLPIDRLLITNTNARKDHLADKAMVASLKSQGLLYPLLVEPLDDGYDVIDGARRLTCIRDGIAAGELDPMVWANIPCIKGNGDARRLGLEQSLHANLHMAMHPLDECEAILRLAEDEDDKAAIGLRFGQDEKWVDQRVKLANLCDEAKALFRDGTIGLAAAMRLTLGAPETQQAFLKAHAKEGFYTDMIAGAMTQKAISAKHVNFALTDYPEEKIQRDLFSEEVWLLDRKLVTELQDAWAQDQVHLLELEGYDKVRLLPKDDWQTLNAYVHVDKVAKKDRPRLTCFLKADNYGFIKLYKDMAPRRAVDDKGKIKKQKQTEDTTDADNVKPQLCTELTVAQHEIINALAASDLYSQVIEGDEMLAQFLVVDHVFGAGTWTQGGDAYRLGSSGGAIQRWERLNRDYPAEQIINGSEIEAIGQLEPQKLDFAVWKGLKEKARDTLYFRACAALIFVPYGQQVLQPALPELKANDWLVPGEDFFKRFRTDQLIDYRRRSGDSEAGKTVKKKGDHVKDCVVAATGRHAFKFGLAPQHVKAARGKKREGGLPDA